MVVKFDFRFETNIKTFTVLFYKVDAACKRFEEDGMVYCWLFRRILVIFDEEHVKALMLNFFNIKTSS